MYLTMTIGKVVVQRLELDYTGLCGAIDIEHYQQRQAEVLKLGNARLIKKYYPKPEFYVDRVPSRMNYEEE